MAWKKTGTINVTSGSDIVTGNNTQFTNAIKKGDALKIGNSLYEIGGFVNSTQLTLAEQYPGTTTSGVAYSIIPTQANTQDLNNNVTELVDIVGDMLENAGVFTAEDGKSAYEIAVDNGFVGTEQEWLDSLKGTDGTVSEVQLQSVVELTQFAGQAAGSSGIYLIVPVAPGDPGVTLTQQAQVIVPFDSVNAGIGMWVNTTTSGLALTIGLTNVPLPQPGGSDEDIDLSGSATFYAPFNAITPLGIDLNGSSASFTLSRNFTDADLVIKRKYDTDIVVPVASQWTTGSSGSPYAVTGDAVASTMTMEKRGEGTTGYTNGHLVLNRDTYIATPALAIEFPSTSDDLTTQLPPSVRHSFKGIVPAGTGIGVILGELNHYGYGQSGLYLHWSENTLQYSYSRVGGTGETILSDSFASALSGTNHLLEAEWVNDENGTGGTVTFYVDGVQLGAPKPTSGKPRVTSSADYEVNASVGNTSNSVDNLEVEYVGLGFGKPDIETTYETIADGAVTLDDLQNLVVDATGVTTQQPERILSYVANGTQQFDLTLVVGEMVLPAGRPYKAVLEDWSTGVGVPHPNELIMTKPAAQNCRFEDSVLYGSQGSWTEVVPQGAVPIIDGIRYGCEGIRQGNYVMFQFVYSQDVPSSPFGDPTNLNTYMRPHKWMIYDNQGTLLQRIEKPNGEPLNAASTKPVWEGTYDGRSVPIITDNNKWYPHGTVRCSIIYRNGTPPAYDQQFVYDNVPVYDQRVPFASHTGYSVNGFDLRIYAGSAGGDGQSNGFANWKIMPWTPLEHTYDSIKTYAANTQDPYTNLYSDISATPNAALWLKYTPFNTMGRCPIVGPGGTRDDRQIMAEVVARYARDVTSTRPHDGRAMADIALDYLTGYASDPFNAVSNGKLKPLFKGNARRNITMRNHYYGGGEATTPEDQAWYAQVGRLSEWTSGTNPLRCNVPGSGATADKPYFGGFEIDNLHAHQFPHWGSLLFQTPEFAMLGVNFSDQSRLYGNSILASMWGPETFSQRETAWPFMHAALLWKTASANSSRLYSRAEVLDWVVYDFETFYDQWYDATPGFLNPPTNIMQNGEVVGSLAVLAGAGKFGPCYYTDGEGLQLSEFQAGYWLSALHAAHRIGFLDALRAASPKAEAIVNWLIAMHRKRVVGRINDGSLMNMAGSDYQARYWTAAEIVAANGNVSSLPQNFAAVVSAHGAAPSWDQWSEGATTYSRDGQAMDQLLAAPALLKDMGLTGADLDQAVSTAESRFQAKLTSEAARGNASAGSEWFKYHQTTNNRPYNPA
ncbi:hypothetical protein [Novosphingobium sp. PY1]|uniref:hypothetical protein n=1 Tax=Novosphingobium sp. PY1 TaxID=1882221 RepID=UPI001A8D8A35|nr:hypothetical protein [Novosphingobium sp. PY1]GFM27162.1 uncharacterized protein PY1_contig-01-23 [Novosphingobium sp. PY1]